MNRKLGQQKDGTNNNFDHSQAQCASAPASMSNYGTALCMQLQLIFLSLIQQRNHEAEKQILNKNKD